MVENVFYELAASDDALLVRAHDDDAREFKLLLLNERYTIYLVGIFDPSYVGYS